MNLGHEFAGTAVDWPPRMTASDPRPLEVGSSLVARVVGPVISLSVLVAAIVSLRHLDLSAVAGLVPRSPGFWLLFALSYLVAPIADWLIFRRLWGIPLAGLVPLVRKQIGNEILLGYVGEVYFYAWARRRVELVAAPFGAIKDVAVLSALVGNLVSLIMLAVAAPIYANLYIQGSATLLWSIAAMLVTSLAAFAIRRRLFGLERRELWFVVGIHLARIVTITGLTAVLWHLALPGVALSWWLLLAAMRLLVSRLPLIPNKDIVFAGIAVLLVGHDHDIGALLAMIASLILSTHVLLGMALMSAELFRADPR